MSVCLSVCLSQVSVRMFCRNRRTNRVYVCSEATLRFSYVLEGNSNIFKNGTSLVALFFPNSERGQFSAFSPRHVERRKRCQLSSIDNRRQFITLSVHRCVAANPGPSQSTWAASAPKIGCYHPHPPSPLLLLLSQFVTQVILPSHGGCKAKST